MIDDGSGKIHGVPNLPERSVASVAPVSVARLPPAATNNPRVGPPPPMLAAPVKAVLARAMANSVDTLERAQVAQATAGALQAVLKKTEAGGDEQAFIRRSSMLAQSQAGATEQWGRAQSAVGQELVAATQGSDRPVEVASQRAGAIAARAPRDATYQRLVQQEAGYFGLANGQAGVVARAYGSGGTPGLQGASQALGQATEAAPAQLRSLIVAEARPTIERAGAQIGRDTAQAYQRGGSGGAARALRTEVQALNREIAAAGVQASLPTVERIAQELGGRAVRDDHALRVWAGPRAYGRSDASNQQRFDATVGDLAAASHQAAPASNGAAAVRGVAVALTRHIPQDNIGRFDEALGNTQLRGQGSELASAVAATLHQAGRQRQARSVDRALSAAGQFRLFKQDPDAVAQPLADGFHMGAVTLQAAPLRNAIGALLGGGDASARANRIVAALGGGQGRMVSFSALPIVYGDQRVGVFNSVLFSTTGPNGKRSFVDDTGRSYGSLDAYRRHNDLAADGLLSLPKDGQLSADANGHAQLVDVKAHRGSNWQEFKRATHFDTVVGAAAVAGGVVALLPSAGTSATLIAGGVALAGGADFAVGAAVDIKDRVQQGQSLTSRAAMMDYLTVAATAMGAGAAGAGLRGASTAARVLGVGSGAAGVAMQANSTVNLAQHWRQMSGSERAWGVLNNTLGAVGLVDLGLHAARPAKFLDRVARGETVTVPFRTLEDVRNLRKALSRAHPDAKKRFDVETVLSELMANAVVQGNLRIPKTGLTTEQVAEQVALGLKRYRGKPAEVAVHIQGGGLYYTITDRGNGFNHVSRMNAIRDAESPVDLDALLARFAEDQVNVGETGRGLGLVYSLVHEMTYYGNGNKVTVVFHLPPEPDRNEHSAATDP